MLGLGPSQALPSVARHVSQLEARRPHALRLLRRLLQIGRYIQQRGGVVAAEELAPYLDVTPGQVGMFILFMSSLACCVGADLALQCSAGRAGQAWAHHQAGMHLGGVLRSTLKSSIHLPARGAVVPPEPPPGRL